MKKLLKKLLKKPLFWFVSVEIIIVIILGTFGFRITYNPDLDNNWDAISACAAWVGVLVSGLALLATLAVLYQNHKTIELSKKDIQNAINLQMFDKMMEIANKIEDNDYSSTTMELITLFGQDVLKQIEELRQLISQKESKESDWNTYYRLLNQMEGYDWNLEQYSQLDNAPRYIVERADKQNEKYRVLFELDELGNKVYYNIDEINADLFNLSSDISTKQKQLKNDVHKIFRNKFPLD